MSDKKLIIGIILVILILGGGAGAYVMFGGQQVTDDTSTRTRQNIVEQLPKTETEKQLDGMTGDEFDRYYIANMIAHHQGAVDMAKLAQTNAKHSELKAMANNIVTAQSDEINNMLSWQKSWGYPASSGEMMVDHSAMGMMEDMDTMLNELKGKTGDEFDKLFLKQMIAHHESAVAMSRPGEKNAGHQEVKSLAKAVIEAQTEEITKMRQWISDWGYES